MKNSFYMCLIFFVLSIIAKGQNCVTSYTYSGSADTLTFINTSTVSNAHYYWSFGDGGGSNVANPVHVYPDDGTYIVTLYCHDTVSDCSSFVEKEISVIKPDTFSCDLYYTDTIIGTSYIPTDLNVGCLPIYTRVFNAGPGESQTSFYMWPGWQSALFLSYEEAWRGLSTNNALVVKEYFRTFKFNYSPSINYQNCSANFEVTLDYQSNGVIAHFSAMNGNASSYKWMITGFGFPIYYTTRTASHFYPYPTINRKSRKYIVVLYTHDAVNNCTDTVTQNILIRNPNPAVYNFVKEATNQITFSSFPNPAKDKLGLVVEGNAAIDKISILNVFGQELLVTRNPGDKPELDISSYPSGIYFLKVENKNNQGVVKIIKE